jgi:hypothetical protein
MTPEVEDRSRQVYLLHCWQERSATVTEKPIWRFAVEKVGLSPAARRGCATLEAVMALLQAELWGEAPGERQAADQVG